MHVTEKRKVAGSIPALATTTSFRRSKPSLRMPHVDVHPVQRPTQPHARTFDRRFVAAEQGPAGDCAEPAWFPCYTIGGAVDR